MPNHLRDWLQSSLNEDIRHQYLSFDFYLPRFQYGLVVGFLIWIFTVCEKGQSQQFVGSNSCHLAKPFVYFASVKEICRPPQMWRSSLSPILFAVQTSSYSCYNTSDTEKSHSRNAVPEADLTAFLMKRERKLPQDATDIREQNHTTEESSCKCFFVLNEAAWPLFCVCSVRQHAGGSGTGEVRAANHIDILFHITWSGLGGLLLKQDDCIDRKTVNILL